MELKREVQKNRLSVLRGHTAQTIEAWRLCAANKLNPEDGAEASGKVIAVVSSMDKPLPKRYRFSLSLYEDGRAQVLLWDMAARLLAPGISTLGTQSISILLLNSFPSHGYPSVLSFHDSCHAGHSLHHVQ